MIHGYIDPGTGYLFTSFAGYMISFFLTGLGVLLFFLKRFFKNKIRIALFVIFVLCLGILVISLEKNRKFLPFEKKIIILAFDGLSPQIIERMMSAKQLPNFSRLKEIGSYHHLKTSNPAQSPVAWSSFATGQNPGKHGIYDFIVRDPKTYNLNLSLSKIVNEKPQRVIQTKTFWQYTSDVKIPTIIIAHPMTFPPDKVYGRMFSGMGVPDILGTEGTFTFYTTEAIGESKDIGGQVIPIDKSPIMVMDLIGPKVKGFAATAENVKIPFKVILNDNASVSIVYQGKNFQLKVGEWSDWQRVVFPIGFFKKIKGVFKFYLVETSPGFKLYVTPINFDPRDPFYPISYPKEYSRELVDEIGLYHTAGMPVDTWAVNEKRLSETHLIAQAREILQEKKSMLDVELKRMRKGLLFCYFGTPDIIQHMFWRFTDPHHPLNRKEEVSEYGMVIDRWYQYMDEVLGTVLQKVSDEDILIVLSDHGFDTFRRTVHINSWLRKNGYLELKNPNAEAGMELLNDIDWSRTKAYALGFGGIYINQKGREGQGIVQPGQETEQLKEDISHKLEQWRDEKHNSRVINKVYSREDIFWGKNADATPDIYIGFNIGYQASWQTAIGGVPLNLIEDNLKKWSGSHIFDPPLVPGIIFSNKVITNTDPSLLDITPTILKIIGYKEEEINKFELDGQYLF